MKNEKRMVAAVLVLVGIVLAVVAQFVPSGNIDGGIAEVNAFPWGVRGEAFGSEDSESWFDAEDDGAGELQAQMVLYYIAMGVAAIGLLGALLSSGNVGMGASALAFLCTLVAVILFPIGIDAAFDGDMDLVTGYFLSIGAGVAFLVGAVTFRL
jgi:hypothetical protein